MKAKKNHKNDTPSPFIPYGRQSIDADDIASLGEVLAGDYLTTGPFVERFENALCETTGARHAVVVGNGTHALHLACLTADLKNGDWAVVPSVTFLATANAVRYCGADVLFCDVDPQTGLMRPEDLQKILDQNKNKTIKAVLPVHLRGESADLQGIKNIADRAGLRVIADACHALGGSYQGKSIGGCDWEDFSVFSFHPVKAITTGEGGAITTNNADWAQKMKILRGHGMIRNESQGLWFYTMDEIGFNYRLSDIQCALGLSQLKKLETFIEKRRELAKSYDELLDSLAPYIQKPQSPEHSHSAWHLYAPRFDFEKMGISRADLMAALKTRNIGTQVHYIPVHTQPYYQDLYGKKHLPGAETYYKHTLSLPLFTSMNTHDVQKIVEFLHDIIDEQR